MVEDDDPDGPSPQDDEFHEGWIDVPGEEEAGPSGGGDDGRSGPTRTVSLDESEGEGEALTPRRERSRLNRALTWILAIALALALVGVVYVATTPQQTGEPFTEFYVLGPDGNASGYPTTLAPGGTGEVIVGVSNHEHQPFDYRVNVTWNGAVTQQTTVSVPDGETRETRLTLTAPSDPGEYHVRFVLYKLNGSARPYRTLRLWVTVNGTAGSG